jgi:helicase
LRISELPLSDEVKDLLSSLGYSELYPTQEAAIEAGLLDGANLLLSTPTASGKTLIAMMAASRLLTESEEKVVYLAPLRALAFEKYEEFSAMERLRRANGRNVRVTISTGDYDSSGEELGYADLLVLTNEKFDSLARHRPSWMRKVGLYIFDEVHLLGDEDRGPTLEVVITRILSGGERAQLLALSATVSNAGQLARWLKAKSVSMNWRPVPLKQGVAYDGRVFFSDSGVLELSVSSGRPAMDLAIDSIRSGGQSLIFAETRKRAVSIAKISSKYVQKFLGFDDGSRLRQLAKKVMAESEATEVSRLLAGCIEGGVAFHHAGLATAHRRIVEKAFREGLIKLLVATPTLAAGINLPARRVVIASIYRYDASFGESRPISVMDYKQMCGRAGRPRFDEYGEALVVAQSEEEMNALMEAYIRGEPEPIRSQLASPSSFRTHTLGVIASSPSLTLKQLKKFFLSTLLAQQFKEYAVMSRLEAAVKYLEGNGLIRLQQEEVRGTPLGKRVATLYIDPESALVFLRALKERRDTAEDITPGLLQLIVMVPDFEPKMALRGRDRAEAEAFVEQYSHLLFYPEDLESGFSDSFRSLLMLHAWINEWSEDRILQVLGVEPGDLHRSVEVAEWLAYAFAELAKLVGYKNVAKSLDLLQVRIDVGCRAELLPLVQLRGIGRVRARNLYQAGYRTISSIASASVSDLGRVPSIGEALASDIRSQALALVSSMKG